MSPGILKNIRSAVSFIALVVFIFCGWNRPDPPVNPRQPVVFNLYSADSSMFRTGEELTYNVSYAFIDIGQVRLQIGDKITRDGRTFYKTKAYIDSYKGVPFVDLHTVYESSVDSQYYSRYFRGRTKTDSGWYYHVYDFDYPGRRIVISQGLGENFVSKKNDTLSIDTLYQDGLSLFYFARSKVLSGKKFSVPTVVGEKKGRTILNYSRVHSDREIDAVNYPVDAVYLEGSADFVGVFGLTGDFEGWFSNDKACVPILAKMGVIIGKISIELIKWKREGWEPPRYVEK